MMRSNSNDSVFSAVAISCRSCAIRWPGSVVFRYLLGIASLAALYYGAAKVGYVMGFSGPVAAIVWLPVGVGIAFLYLGGLRFWPGVVIGDLLANDYTKLLFVPAFGGTFGNLLEVVLAAALIKRLIPNGSPLGSPRSFARLLGALAAGTLLSATIGPVSLALGDVITTSAMPDIMRTWWLGDLAGALVVVPLALAWYPLPKRSALHGRVLEGGLCLVAVVVLSELALRSHSPWSYLILPALVWAALRFGPRGATLAILIATAFTVWNTTHYEGAFAFESINRSVLNTQLFIAVAAVSTLCLVALVSEREDYAERLGASRNQLLQASDSERRRIERNLHDGAQQRLLALAVLLNLAAERTRESPEGAPAIFAEAEADLQLAIGELRELAHGIHPSVLTNLGLADAIRSLAAGAGIPITLDELPSSRLDDTAEAIGYYVVSEAITNARKYGRANEIHVRAALHHKTLRVEVLDDGAGGAVLSDGSGLAGLRDRVESAGGVFDVVSQAGRGTRVLASIPARTR